MKFLLSVAPLLLLVFSGCGGPHRAVLPPVGDDPDQVPAGYRVLRVGDYVRIETRSRDVMLGEVKEVTQDHVVLGRAGNFGYVERSFQAKDILSIELNGGDTAGSAVGSVGAILGVTVVVFALAFLLFPPTGMN